MKANKFCQSCGMPMKEDPNKGSTNADGSINTTYCSYCFENGEFRHPGPVKEFQEFCRLKMIEGGHSRILSWLFTRGMSRLERWKQ